jgi:hypothetical protein
VQGMAPPPFIDFSAHRLGASWAVPMGAYSGLRHMTRLRGFLTGQAHLGVRCCGTWQSQAALRWSPAASQIRGLACSCACRILSPGWRVGVFELVARRPRRLFLGSGVGGDRELQGHGAAVLEFEGLTSPTRIGRLRSRTAASTPATHLGSLQRRRPTRGASAPVRPRSTCPSAAGMNRTTRPLRSWAPAAAWGALM